MQQLFDIQQSILQVFTKKPFLDRDTFKRIKLVNRITGIVGPRGVGKTTYLLHQILAVNAKEQQALYVSADNVYFSENRLFDLVDRLHKETDVRLICIDEVHKYPNWQQVLKNIVDTFLDFKVLFTGSSAIDIIRSKYDLSRRVTLYPLHGFSLREYLNFCLKIDLPRLTLAELVAAKPQFGEYCNTAKILKYFKDYLEIGYYPFYPEIGEKIATFQAIENAVQKTIYEDIGSLHSLKTPTLSIIEKLYKLIIISSVGELSAYKLASLLSKSYESISTYLNYLEQAGLIRFLTTEKSGKAFIRKPVKMYPENTNMIYASLLPQTQDGMMGKVRETFAMAQLQNAGYSVYYSEAGDLKVDGMTFEIGGKNKTTKQIKNIDNAYVLADGILTSSKRIIPLFLLGFLY